MNALAYPLPLIAAVSGHAMRSALIKVQIDIDEMAVQAVAVVLSFDVRLSFDMWVGVAYGYVSTARTRACSAGTTSCANHGLALSQMLLRGLG